MKVFLAIVIGAAVVFFLVRSRPAVEQTAGARATPVAHLVSPVPATPVPPAFASTSAPAPTMAVQSTTLYKMLLRPAYVSLIDSTVRGTDLRYMNQEATELRALLSTAPQTRERDAALRLCAIVDQAATLTRNVVRNNQPTPRSQPTSKNRADLERAEKEAAAKDAFFMKADETQWRAQIVPLQAAARNEWAQIPDNAIFASSALTAYGAARAQRLRQRQQ